MLTRKVVCKKCLQAGTEAQCPLLVFMELEGPMGWEDFYCLALLYNKQFGQSLSLAPWRVPLNPWTFLSDRSVFIIYVGPWIVWDGLAMLERPTRVIGDLGI